MDIIMHSREGVIQGGPLAMITYGLGIIPLIKNLKTAHPGITQPWYAEDAGALGTFGNIEEYFNYLTQVDLEHEY